jgi:hypothetical protein
MEDWRGAAWAQPLLGKAAQPMASTKVLGALNWLLLILIIVAALVKIYQPLAPGAVDRATRDSLPADAVAAIQELRPAGPMFNSYNWGGYLIFTLWPDYPVFVDGRTDLYDEAFLRQYIRIYMADDVWQDSLDEYDIRLVIIEANSVLAKFMRMEPMWREAYRDDMAAVFTRDTVP